MPTIMRHGTVKPDWVDYNGHMGDYAYTIVFSEALDGFIERVGLPAVYDGESGCTLRLSELRIAFLREFHEGDAFEVRLQIIEEQAQSLRLFGRMIDRESGRDAALSDQVLLYASPTADGIGHACDFPEAVRLKLSQLRGVEPDAPSLPWVESRIGIRRKV